MHLASLLNKSYTSFLWNKRKCNIRQQVFEKVNFHYFKTGEIGISIDETTDYDDVDVLLDIFATAAENQASLSVDEYGVSTKLRLKCKILIIYVDWNHDIVKSWGQYKNVSREFVLVNEEFVRKFP